MNMILGNKVCFYIKSKGISYKQISKSVPLQFSKYSYCDSSMSSVTHKLKNAFRPLKTVFLERFEKGKAATKIFKGGWKVKRGGLDVTKIVKMVYFGRWVYLTSSQVITPVSSSVSPSARLSFCLIISWRLLFFLIFSRKFGHYKGKKVKPTYFSKNHVSQNKWENTHFGGIARVFVHISGFSH